MKVAIVGSGIAGLSAAWLLNQSGHEITLLERLPAVGLNAHAVEFCESDLSIWQPAIDSRRRAAKDVQSFPLAESVSTLRSNRHRNHFCRSIPNICGNGGRTSLQLGMLNRRMERGTQAVNSRLSDFPDSGLQRGPIPAGKTVRRIMREIRRMMVDVPAEVNSEKIENLDFISYLKQRQYSEEFVYQFLFPFVGLDGLHLLL